MKILITAAVVLMTAGCSSDTPTDDYESSLSRSSSSSSDSQRELGYTLLRQQVDAFDNYSDSEIDDAAEITCRAFDDGLTGDQVFIAGMQTNGTDQGALMAFSTIAYCPEHQSTVDAWVNSNG